MALFYALFFSLVHFSFWTGETLIAVVCQKRLTVSRAVFQVIHSIQIFRQNAGHSLPKGRQHSPLVSRNDARTVGRIRQEKRQMIIAAISIIVRSVFSSPSI
jgi:hypothetical protein